MSSQGVTGLPSSTSFTPNYYDWCNQKNIDEATLSIQKEKDLIFFNEFMSSVQTKKSDVVKTIKMFEVKQLLLHIIAIKKNLEVDLISLSPTDLNYNAKWSDITSNMNKIKDMLGTLQSNEADIKKCISKKLKIREARKRRRLRHVNFKKQKREEIERKHKIIDKLLSERSDEVESIKREAALKRQADAVLHEVRKKKNEAKKMLNLLCALAKLRDLRIKQEEERGGYCSKQLTETFNKVMKRFQELWEKQLEMYNLEEKGLKIMLEESAMPPVKESKFEINLLEWEKALFGDISNNEYEKLLTASNYDSEALIQVRREWDQFLVVEPTAMSSSIPLGWVLPPETENDEWKNFLLNSNKK